MKLKFVCLNAWEGGRLLDAAAAFIAREQPDILALQEAYDEPDDGHPPHHRSVSVLRQAGAFPYYNFAPTYIDIQSGNAVQGNAILSKFPIIETKNQFYVGQFGDFDTSHKHDWPQAPRNLQSVTLRIDGQDCHVFNTQGIWGWDGLDNPARLQMGRFIAEAVAGQPNTILCGDFNVRPQTRTIAMIEERLTNVFGNTHQPASTFNTRQKSDPVFAEAVVDMLFVSSDLEILSRQCPDVDVSDHLPLIATLGLPADHLLDQFSANGARIQLTLTKK